MCSEFVLIHYKRCFGVELCQLFVEKANMEMLFEYFQPKFNILSWPDNIEVSASLLTATREFLKVCGDVYSQLLHGLSCQKLTFLDLVNSCLFLLS
jgi:hypothetical protein